MNNCTDGEGGVDLRSNADLVEYGKWAGSEMGDGPGRFFLLRMLDKFEGRDFVENRQSSGAGGIRNGKWAWSSTILLYFGTDWVVSNKRAILYFI